jgi:hypothetical protein
LSRRGEICCIALGFFLNHITLDSLKHVVVAGGKLLHFVAQFYTIMIMQRKFVHVSFKRRSSRVVVALEQCTLAAFVQLLTIRYIGGAEQDRHVHLE